MSDEIARQLTRIGDALEYLVELLAQPPEEPLPGVCLHEDRVDLGDGEWECPTCRERYTPPATGAPEGASA